MDFSFQFPALVRNSDRIKATKHLRYIGLVQVVGFAMGIFLNIKAKSIYPNILRMPFLKRIGLRLIILSIPGWAAYELFSLPERAKLNELITSMHQRIVLLGKDGDIYKYYTAQ